jgi:DNA-binding CsgD family transcriptional regulator
MNPDAIRSLSMRQAECLRLVARDRDAKEIGRLLGISDETVERHIKLAMRKLGANSRFNAARALADHEGRDHPVVIPPDGAKTSGGHDPSDISAAAFSRSGPTERELREERTMFDLSEAPAPSTSAPEVADRNRLSIGVRLLLCVVAFLALAVGLAGIGSAMQQLSGWVHSRAPATRVQPVQGPQGVSRDVEQDARGGHGR